MTWITPGSFNASLASMDVIFPRAMELETTQP